MAKRECYLRMACQGQTKRRIFSMKTASIARCISVSSYKNNSDLFYLTGKEYLHDC